MKALVYQGPARKAWQDVPPPRIERPTDVIVRIDTATICGTDLHILKGDVPAVTPGRILGHEGVGVITELGSSVTTLAVGDNVIISCIKSCGAGGRPCCGASLNSPCLCASVVKSSCQIKITSRRRARRDTMRSAFAFRTFVRPPIWRQGVETGMDAETIVHVLWSGLFAPDDVAALPDATRDRGGYA